MKPDHWYEKRREEHLAYVQRNGCEFLVAVNELNCI